MTAGLAANAPGRAVSLKSFGAMDTTQRLPRQFSIMRVLPSFYTGPDPSFAQLHTELYWKNDNSGKIELLIQVFTGRKQQAHSAI